MTTLPSPDLTSPTLAPVGDEPGRCRSQSLTGNRCTLPHGHVRNLTAVTSGHTWEVQR